MFITLRRRGPPPIIHACSPGDFPATPSESLGDLARNPFDVFDKGNMLRVVMNGRIDEIVELAKTNLWR